MWSMLRWLGGCLLFGTLALALLVVLVPRVTGLRFVSVLSDSMSPTFERGGVLVVRPVDPSTIQVGDVIVFRQTYDSSSTIAHRVVAVTGTGSSFHFETKGDANEVADRELVPAAQVVGKVEFDVPLLGHAAHHLRTPLVFLLMIGIPGGLIIALELWNIARVLRGHRSTTFEAKGDANGVPNREGVPAADLVGKAELGVPNLGHARADPKTALVFLLVMGIPGGLFMALGLWNIVKALRRQSRSLAGVDGHGENA